jgi:uncharacterized membrane protein
LVTDHALYSGHVWRHRGSLWRKTVKRFRNGSRSSGAAILTRAVTIHKIINVAAPVEEVFAFWSDYQNFPRFMSNVRDVKITG